MPTRRNSHRAKTVRDLMTTTVITIELDAPVSRAIELLADGHVSGLAVLDHQFRLVGVVSTTDIVNAEAEAASDPDRERLWSLTLVRDVMTSHALSVSPDLELREAALQMDYGDVHRLFVIEEDRLIGVISRSDISRAFATGTLG